VRPVEEGCGWFERDIRRVDCFPRSIRWSCVRVETLTYRLGSEWRIELVADLAGALVRAGG